MSSKIWKVARRRIVIITNQNNFFQARLLIDDFRDPYKHFAVEEGILRQVADGVSPATLRIRRFYPSVWIGVNQYLEEDVDLAYCQREQIPIVRRPNPGGAVYQDEGSFCYSFFFRTKSFLQHLGIKDTKKLYSLFGRVIIETIGTFGLKADYSGVNDVTINNRKVYGSAQLELNDAFVHSGTFLVKTNIDRLANTLRPSKLKFIDKKFTNVKERVINFSDALQRDISIEDVYHVLIQKMAEILRINFSPPTKELLLEEEKLMEILYKTKYATAEWNYREKPKLEKTVSMKTKSGIITLSVTLDSAIIKEMVLSGDFLFAKKKEQDELIEQLIGQTITTALKKISVSSLSEEIKRALTILFTEVKGDECCQGKK
ncbi:MAG: lipoyl protein ligase domain-containing protein [Candidatus Heimdallarchaeota archaeon]